MALIFDEFQEVVMIDPGLPKLMRTIFEQQPEVGHVYLGSRRHMMERIFNDENEPFWRSAKQMELTMIEPAEFRGFIRDSFESDQQGHRRRDSSTPPCGSPTVTPTGRRSSATSSGSRRPSTRPRPAPSSSGRWRACCAPSTPT